VAAGATADRLGQAASRVTTLAAGIAIGIGLASVNAAPASSPTPTASAHTPTATSTAQSAPSISVAIPSGTPTAAPTPTVPVPSASASPSANAAESATARGPVVQPPPPSPTAAPPVRHTRTATPPVQPPVARPPAVGPAPAVDARLVSSGKLSRFSLRVRSQVSGDITVRVSNASGSGGLVVGNASWTCSPTSAWSVTCSGQNGQVLFEQSGADQIAPVLVRITDASGATFTRVVTPS
jgi:hypothetical protein